MSENLHILQDSSREEQYKNLLPQIQSLYDPDVDLVANCANITAALKMVFDFFWIGFYFVKNNELILGPFQGSIACTRIGFGKGVCGTAWKEKCTIIVPDVNLFDGHIACSSDSKSEIVVPVFSNDQVIAVLDIDSDKLDDFSEADAFYLEQIVKILCNDQLC